MAKLDALNALIFSINPQVISEEVDSLVIRKSKKNF
jgi:hypothetical protein